MKEKREKQHWIFKAKARASRERRTRRLQKENERRTQNNTETMGRPFFVQYVNIRGACPRMARPYKMREAQNTNELPAENALVKIAALMMEGNVWMPARLIAMTYGDWVALPVPLSKAGSSYGTSTPVIKTPRR